MLNGQTNTGSSGPKEPSPTPGSRAVVARVHTASIAVTCDVPSSPLVEFRIGLLSPSLFVNEEEVDQLIAGIKKAKTLAWPKELKPLCPASASLLTYLKLHADVTPIKAREELGIEHLPRRIKDLKEHGHTIRTEIKRGFAGKRYAHYVLVKPQEGINHAHSLVKQRPSPAYHLVSGERIDVDSPDHKLSRAIDGEIVEALTK